MTDKSMANRKLSSRPASETNSRSVDSTMFQEYRGELPEGWRVVRPIVEAPPPEPSPQGERNTYDLIWAVGRTLRPCVLAAPPGTSLERAFREFQAHRISGEVSPADDSKETRKPPRRPRAWRLLRLDRTSGNPPARNVSGRLRVFVPFLKCPPLFQGEQASITHTDIIVEVAGRQVWPPNVPRPPRSAEAEAKKGAAA